jgi:hypothetical protein
MPKGLLGDLTGIHKQLDHRLVRCLRRTYKRTAGVAATALRGARGIATAARTAQGARSSGTRGEINRSHDGAAQEAGRDRNKEASG